MDISVLSENNKKRYSYCINIFQSIVTDTASQSLIIESIKEAIKSNKILVLMSSNDELKKALSNLYTLYRNKNLLCSYYCQNIQNKRMEQLLIFDEISKRPEVHEVIFFDGFNHLTPAHKEKVLTDFKSLLLLAIDSETDITLKENIQFINLFQYDHRKD